MHVVVTGGCGFIGSHLADALCARGEKVVILDDLSTGSRSNAPKSAEIIVGDVADAVLVDSVARGAKAMFHLAAIASVQRCEEDRASTARTNVGGTEAIFAAAAAQHIPVIYASSAAIYGENPVLPLAETATPAPLSAYGRDKLANEHTARTAWEASGVPSIGLRFFNVFGPRQDPKSPSSGVISIFAQAAADGRGITYFGNGEQTRDFIFVGDIVKLLLAAHSQALNSARIVNGCTGHATSLVHLRETLAKLTGAALPCTHAPARAGDIQHSLGCPHAAQTLLGFTAATPLEEGLRALLTELRGAHAA
jgi:UDP-glucose 4-epimerase